VRKSANKIAGKGMVQYNGISMFVTASTDRTITDIRITNTGIYCHCEMPNWFLNLQNTCNMSTKYPQITQNKEQFTFSKTHFWKHKTQFCCHETLLDLTSVAVGTFLKQTYSSIFVHLST
jgi:hypothetical protein